MSKKIIYKVICRDCFKKNLNQSIVEFGIGTKASIEVFFNIISCHLISIRLY